MNDRFENDLRRALERREPPAGFTERVMAGLGAEPKRSLLERFFSEVLSARRWAPALAACLIIVLAAGTWEYRRIEQRREAERTKQELIFALQVTSMKLERTKAKLLQNVGGIL
jgi:hypothetical protein